jgi:hypothetical protein
VLLWEEKVMVDELSRPNPSQKVSVLVVDGADVIHNTAKGILKRRASMAIILDAFLWA